MYRYGSILTINAYKRQYTRFKQQFTRISWFTALYTTQIGVIFRQKIRGNQMLNVNTTFCYKTIYLF